MSATLLALTVVASAPAPYPRLEAYRLCGVRTAAQLERDRPEVAADVLARDATLRCDPLLGAAADETVTKAGLSKSRGEVMTDFRQRSIADLAYKISTLRASKK